MLPDPGVLRFRLPGSPQSLPTRWGCQSGGRVAPLTGPHRLLEPLVTRVVDPLAVGSEAVEDLRGWREHSRPAERADPAHRPPTDAVHPTWRYRRGGRWPQLPTTGRQQPVDDMSWTRTCWSGGLMVCPSAHKGEAENDGMEPASTLPAGPELRSGAPEARHDAAADTRLR